VCGPGQTLLVNDNLPPVPVSLSAVSVIQGLCEDEACGAVFDVSGIGPQVRVRGAAVGFVNGIGLPGLTAAVDLEYFDGITWSGGIPTLGPSVFRWSTATGTNLQVTSSGINTVTLPSTVNVTVTSGKLVCAWWMILNPNGTCAGGYPTNFATDNAALPGFFCDPTVTPPQKNLIYILGQGWRDAATATVSGIPLCPLFYSGNWLMRACVEPATCPAPLTLGAGTAGTGGIVPTLSTSGGTAQIGNAGFGFAIASGRGGAPALLVLNAVETSLPFAGGTIFVLPGVALATVLGGAPGAPGAGSATIGISIPANPALVGATVTGQAGIFDPAANSSFALTAGLRVTICM
jgi:hypothetical protein